ncbi:hypothetical protein C3L33_17482, partial [Rhododendron williamsianum]
MPQPISPRLDTKTNSSSSRATIAARRILIVGASGLFLSLDFAFSVSLALALSLSPFPLSFLPPPPPPASFVSENSHRRVPHGSAFCAIAQPVPHSQSLLWSTSSCESEKLFLDFKAEFPLNRMGRKAGGLSISSQKFGALQKTCMKEMTTFLNCLALNQNNDEKCVQHKELLSMCMDGQVMPLTKF